MKASVLYAERVWAFAGKAEMERGLAEGLIFEKDRGTCGVRLYGDGLGSAVPKGAT